MSVEKGWKVVGIEENEFFIATLISLIVLVGPGGGGFGAVTVVGGAGTTRDEGDGSLNFVRFESG